MTDNIKQIITEMREKEKAASAGSWQESWQCNTSWLICGPKNPYEGADGFLEHDAKFMAFARNNITAILDYVEKLEKQLDYNIINEEVIQQDRPTSADLEADSTKLWEKMEPHFQESRDKMCDAFLKHLKRKEYLKED